MEYSKDGLSPVEKRQRVEEKDDGGYPSDDEKRKGTVGEFTAKSFYSLTWQELHDGFWAS
jgi:hypothetical protein